MNTTKSILPFISISIALHCLTLWLPEFFQLRQNSRILHPKNFMLSFSSKSNFISNHRRSSLLLIGQQAHSRTAKHIKKAKTNILGPKIKIAKNTAPISSLHGPANEMPAQESSGDPILSNAEINALTSEYYPPQYPRSSLLLGEEGQVDISIQILAGKIIRAEIMASSGFTRLDQEALRAINTWKFPMGFNYKYIQRINFTLE